jgi:pyridoxine 4-dehydrogenase
MAGMTSAADAGTWTLGDLTVCRLGFGAMRLTGGRPLDPEGLPSDRDEAVAVLRRAIELGVNHIDTAAFYFSALRSANELINNALAPYPDDLVITTKVGPGRDPHGNWTPRANPDQLRGQVEENIRQLGRDHLDVVNLRWGFTLGPISEHFGAMADLQKAGLIRHLGISAVVPEHLTQAQAIAPVVCVQNPYGIGARPEGHAFMRECAERGVAFVPFFAIAGRGRERGTDGESNATTETVDEVARAHGATAAQIRLAWTLAQGQHVLGIPGTGNLEHLEQNVAAAAIRLSEDERATLESLPPTVGERGW